MSALSSWISIDLWLVNIIFLLVAGVILSLLEYLLSYRLLPVYKRKGYHWHIALAESFHIPAQIFIWTLVVLLAVRKVFIQFHVDTSVMTGMHTFRSLVVALFAFWFMMRFVKSMEAVYHDRVTKGIGRIKDRTRISAFAQIFRVVIIILFLLILLPIFGIPTAALLTFGGASTLAIGFATKDTLANFLGGLMIYWDRPFSVGDWISSPDKEIEGTVEEIGWRLTRIRTFDKRPLYVPNGVFSTISILNPSRMTNRRIKKNVGVRYSDATTIPAMLSAVETMLKEHPEIDTGQTLMVNLFEFGESSLNFFIYTFTKTTNWIKFEGIQQDVLLKTYEIIRQHGADCAFPTRTLDLPDALQIRQAEST